jgi:hypothetical protein
VSDGILSIYKARTAVTGATKVGRSEQPSRLPAVAPAYLRL